MTIKIINEKVKTILVGNLAEGESFRLGDDIYIKTLVFEIDKEYNCFSLNKRRSTYVYPNTSVTLVDLAIHVKGR